MQHLPVTGVEIDAQGLRSAAHVADAHGAGVSMAAHLAEGLHLHGADKGHQHIGQRIDPLRQKAHHKQQDDLRQDDELPPMHLFHVLEMAVNTLGRKDPQ